MAGHKNNSMETILTFENRNISQWSAVWSTSNVTASGPVGAGWQNIGRRRLRMSALSLGAFLTMHCKLTASTLTGGFFIYVIFLVVSVMTLANPLRHFEVYLGQWSISGPGRAFRILPMFDGIGAAMCVNALVRAITCCTIAAITGIYLVHAVSDEKLPFTYCRDFDLQPYKPIIRDIRTKALYEVNIVNNIIFNDWRRFEISQKSFTSPTVGLLRNGSATGRGYNNYRLLHHMEYCNENYTGMYPALYDTPAYNFFYVELMHLRSDRSLKTFNSMLIYSIIVIWIVIWLVLIAERINNRRMTWNRLYRWFVIVPWIWGIVLFVSAVGHYSVIQYKLKYAFRVSAKEMFVTVVDALDVAIYIHAAGLGSELIFGKGLNHYASGHIDPYLDNENIWHSVTLCLLAALHSGGASACAFVDYLQLDTNHRIGDMRESSLWVLPMYSKCVTEGTHTYLKSCLVFGGLTLSYMVVAYTMLKTAIHTIFEYKVSLVYWEQLVVACLIILCMGLSIIFATNGGILLLESVDATMSSLATPIIVLMELVAMLYVYRGHDFQSDMNLSMEETACGSRISTQWQIIPFITFGSLAVKSYTILNSELPSDMLLLSMIPVVIVIMAMALRAFYNAYLFLIK